MRFLVEDVTPPETWLTPILRRLHLIYDKLTGEVRIHRHVCHTCTETWICPIGRCPGVIVGCDAYYRRCRRFDCEPLCLRKS